MKDTKTRMACLDNSHGFQIKNLRGYTLSIGIGPHHYCENNDMGYDHHRPPLKDTSTMEVAIMNGCGDFVCLPHDVSGHVPVARLAALIKAVQAHDWAGVCFLCDEDYYTEDKFPQKVVDTTPTS
jgi:hypothetical protein|tara:strand:- start:446 stop:820 length:375 start_codon:yes stop_codon:yes gene_type:complete